MKFSEESLESECDQGNHCQLCLSQFSLFIDIESFSYRPCSNHSFLSNKLLHC